MPSASVFYQTCAVCPLEWQCPVSEEEVPTSALLQPQPAAGWLLPPVSRYENCKQRENMTWGGADDEEEDEEIWHEEEGSWGLGSKMLL